MDNDTPAGHIEQAFEIYKALIPVGVESEFKLKVTVSCSSCEKDEEDIRNDITLAGLEDYKL